MVEPDGVTLTLADNSPKSALDGMPKFVSDGNLTPDFYAVNTMQPPYQPSANPPAAGGDPAFADPAQPTTLPPQTEPTIGDLLSAQGRQLGLVRRRLAGTRSTTATATPVPNFQYHHQPFNYYANFAPGHRRRAPSICATAASSGASFIKAIDAGKLPQVAFYKPQGNLNEHSGYADIAAGDQHIADVDRPPREEPAVGAHAGRRHLRRERRLLGPCRAAQGRPLGPGHAHPGDHHLAVRQEAAIVDHTPYDTTSILRFITERFELPALRGIVARDEALAANGEPPLGDLTNALKL